MHTLKFSNAKPVCSAKYIPKRPLLIRPSDLIGFRCSCWDFHLQSLSEERLKDPNEFGSASG